MTAIDLISVIVWDYMWGMPLVLVILSAGLYLSLRTGFFQVTGFRVAMRHAIEKVRGQDREKNRVGILS